MSTYHDVWTQTKSTGVLILVSGPHIWPSGCILGGFQTLFGNFWDFEILGHFWGLKVKKWQFLAILAISCLSMGLKMVKKLKILKISFRLFTNASSLYMIFFSWHVVSWREFLGSIVWTPQPHYKGGESPFFSNSKKGVVKSSLKRGGDSQKREGVDKFSPGLCAFLYFPYFRSSFFKNYRLRRAFFF